MDQRRYLDEFLLQARLDLERSLRLLRPLACTASSALPARLTHRVATAVYELLAVRREVLRRPDALQTEREQEEHHADAPDGDDVLLP